jgi:hypothetical protein
MWLTNRGYCFLLIILSVFWGWLFNEILNSEKEIKAAWIQGCLTFIAGEFVLWAAYLTYKPIKVE